MHIWYKNDTATPQYIVVRQCSAEDYRSTHPHEKDDISFHPDFVVRLGCGSRAGFLFMDQTLDGTSFTPEWIRHKWRTEWISGGIRHSVTGINLGANDIVRIVEEFSGQLRINCC